MNRDIVFIDTSIYIAENYFQQGNGNRLSTLQRLVAEGLISVVSTEMTNREVLLHYKEAVSAALNMVKNHHPVLNNFKETENLLSRTYKKYMVDKAELRFKEFLEKTHVYTIGYEYCTDVATIFEKYFKIEKPFGIGDKRKEFPDAFVLQMLESYCKKNGLKIKVLSGDGDMRDYESQYLEHVDYKAYITEKTAEANVLLKIKKALEQSREHICGIIESQLSDELYDDRNYIGLFNTEDAPDVEVMECSIDMDDDFSIVYEDHGVYTLELHMTSYCEVKCSYTSLDYAIYDREDRRWYGGEGEIETITGDEYFSIHATFDIDDEYGGLEMTDFDVVNAIPSFKHQWEH